MNAPTWIELRPDADVATVVAELAERGVWAHASVAGQRTGLALGAHSALVAARDLETIPGVAAVFAPASAHPRLDAQAGAPVLVAGLALGGPTPILAAGPCAAESRAQVDEAAAAVAQAGGGLLRGGAFKPRTSPYRFAGLGQRALDWLAQAAENHGLGLVTEAMSERDLPAVAEVAHLIQIGSRNMQNYALLRAVGATGRPVLLKRGSSARLDEWRLAAEHVLAAGSSGVVFCERGVRGTDPSTRNLLDLGAVAHLRWIDRQPVFVDPSHALGRRDLIPALSRAALAAGAHGLLLEMHPHPGRARCDGPQALTPDDLGALVAELREPRPGLGPGRDSPLKRGELEPGEQEGGEP
jgi:3-deoxy-7-phosphoheptulonate synthase